MVRTIEQKRSGNLDLVSSRNHLMSLPSTMRSIMAPLLVSTNSLTLLEKNGKKCLAIEKWKIWKMRCKRSKVQLLRRLAKSLIQIFKSRSLLIGELKVQSHLSRVKVNAAPAGVLLQPVDLKVLTL